MDLSRQALQTNGKFFSNFELVLEFLAENPKIFKRMLIKVQRLVAISIYSS